MSNPIFNPDEKPVVVLWCQLHHDDRGEAWISVGVQRRYRSATTFTHNTITKNLYPLLRRFAKAKSATINWL
jgi:hypothetical protein